MTRRQKRREKYVVKGMNYNPSPTKLSMAKNNYSFEKLIDKSLKTHKSRRFPFTDTYMNWKTVYILMYPFLFSALL